jgi:hypothetical protein
VVTLGVTLPTTIAKVFVAVRELSLATSVTQLLPAAVGVPEKVRVSEFRVIPPGNPEAV